MPRSAVLLLRSAVLLLASSLAACHGSDRPAAPSPAPGPVPYFFPPVVVTGLVMEHLPAGPRPLAGLRFDVQTDPAGDDFPLAVTSAEDGTFRVSVPHGSAFRVVVPPGGGFHAPCATGPGLLVEDSSLNLHVVSERVLAGDGLPPSLPLGKHLVRGRVSVGALWWDDITPLAGVTVELAPRRDALSRSSSVTAPDGRFVLCGSPAGGGQDTTQWLRARKDGYESGVAEIPAGSAETVELWLTPR